MSNHVHRWIGNTCTECGVAHNIAQEQEITTLRAKLDRAAALAKQLDPGPACLCAECKIRRELQKLLTEP